MLKILNRLSGKANFRKIVRKLSAQASRKTNLTLLDHNYNTDEFTNITEKIANHLGRNLHVQPNHPLSHVRQRIVNYFYKSFRNSGGNPLFSVYDNLNPVVSVEQNFDTLLVPKDHPSRSKTDCYYLNKDYLLRAHMTAHQSELMKSGLDNFLMVGDVYRRDEIDRTHYPVFHQMDGVRMRSKNDLFQDEELHLFETDKNLPETQEKQACHTLESVKLMEHELKSTLSGLARELFGNKIEYRWVETYFPFTHPSWELEVHHKDHWLELLGCGIMRQPILKNSGVRDKIGWAFGLGLERVAMCLYQIPDIRLFWSQDSGFLNQFKGKFDDNVVYKPISQYPQCNNDVSFWLPKIYNSNDFYDLVRNIGGDIVEQVVLIDEFTHPKSGKTSHCYRIVYRHMEKTLTQDEVNSLHKEISEQAVKLLGITLR